jgi:hypothetical protein
MRASLLWVTAAAVTCTVARLASAQSTVQSRFVGQDYPFAYSSADNWSPAEVPNNSAARHYDVTIDQLGKYYIDVQVDIDATVSNLTIAGSNASLRIDGKTLAVEGTTSLLNGPGVSVFSGANHADGVFDAGSLATFADHALAGTYILVSDTIGRATLQFRDADIVTLRDARLALFGPLSAVTDEGGNDALRNFARIESTSALELAGRTLTVTSPFTNDGTLSIGNYEAPVASFDAVGGLTNFDAATRTLSGGRFELRAGSFSASAAQAELRFTGADIVTNASALALSGPGARITDLTGADALRNLARNTPGAVLALVAHDFATLGDFTNDGRLELSQSQFVITGRLTNFDDATRTLAGGTYVLDGQLRFRGADVVHNGAEITLSAGGIVDELGNDALRDVAENLSPGALIIGTNRDFATRGSFTNAGRVETFAAGFGIPENMPRDSTFTVPASGIYSQTAGQTVNHGILTAPRVEILGGSLTGGGIIAGDVVVDNATAYPAGGQIDGTLTLSSASHFRSVIGEYRNYGSWYVSKAASLAGTLEVEITAENFLSTDEVLTILRSNEPLSGTFANAPNGTRLTTIDGAGSFRVSYDATSVKLTEFQANPPTAQLLNISTRGYLDTGENGFANQYLVAGFIVTGPQPKTVIVRGIGPSLSHHGVDGAVPNPVLELRSAGTSIATNDDWMDTQKDEIVAAGLAPGDSRESAIKATLAPGAYTVLLQEKDEAIGHALVEVYDLSPSTSSRLANISTLGFVPADSVLIGGVIAGGEGMANADVVIRARGPSLWGSGAYNVMADPTLALRDANGNLFAFRNDLMDSNDQDRAIPYELMLANPHEALMHVQLPPGSYTAVVREKDGHAGKALVEVYDLRH